MKSYLKRTAFILVLATSPIAHAQLSPDLIMETYNNNVNGIISATVHNDVMNATLKADRKTGIDPNTGVRSTGANSAGSLTYTPTAALKKATVQQYVERLKTKNPAASQAIAAAFGPGKYDYGTIYNDLVKGNGLRENDAVDAVTAYMVLGYMITHNIQDGNAVTPAMVQSVRAQFGPKLAQNDRLTAPGVPGQLGEEMKLQVVVVQSGWQSAIKENTLAAYQQGISTLFKNQWGLDFSQLTLTDRGFAASNQPATTSKATTGNRPDNTGSRPATNPRPSAVDGWFFRAVSGYPAAISFEPVVLFSNGDYYEIGEQPLDMVDVTRARQSKPNAWGTWQKKGGAYWLTNAKNQSTEYKLGAGNWFPAYPYSASIPLKKGYERVSGGDYGQGTTALSVTNINFLDATHFSEGLDAGITAPNAAGWKKGSASGTYKLYGNTLELTYSDGKLIKKSFAFGATGSPARPTNTLIFIGGDAYTDKD